MRYLLDTQVIIWSLAAPEKLSSDIKKLLDDTLNFLFISPVSVYEIQQKRKLKKLLFDVDILELVDDKIFYTLDLSLAHSLYTINLPLIHRDPFDRMLIAQSIVEKMPLLTADREIQKYDFSFVKV